MEREVFETDPENRNYRGYHSHRDRWVRASNSYLAGVCEGVGNALGVPSWVVRVCWLIAILFFGTGLFFYFALAVSLPREDERYTAYQPRFLGVCMEISRRVDMEVGLIRLLTVLMSVLSLGATVVGYIVLYFFVRNRKYDH